MSEIIIVDTPIGPHFQFGCVALPIVPDEPDVCKWEYVSEWTSPDKQGLLGYYQAACGGDAGNNYPDGFKFCPFCGRRIEVAE